MLRSALLMWFQHLKVVEWKYQKYDMFHHCSSSGRKTDRRIIAGVFGILIGSEVWEGSLLIHDTNSFRP